MSRSGWWRRWGLLSCDAELSARAALVTQPARESLGSWAGDPWSSAALHKRYTGGMSDLYDRAPAWLVPQLFFGVNWAEDEQRVKPQRHPESWEDYPVMPMLLPDTGLFLRYCILRTEPDNPFSRHLMLLLRSRSGADVQACQAWYVSGAVMGLLALANMLMIDPRDAEPIPIPPAFMPAYEVDRPALLDALGLLHAVGDPTWEGLTSLCSVGSRWDQLFRLLPALLSDRGLWRGAQYLIASLRLFTFMGDDMIDTLHDRDMLPETPYAMVDAESALWLAYKALESVVGDPPGNSRRLDARLRELRVVDFPGVWRGEVPVDLATRIRRFEAARDRRAAHGRHHANREPLSYFEVMDWQYFARLLLIHYANKTLERLQLPRPLF